MSKKSLIISIFLILLVLAIILSGTFIYFFMKKNNRAEIAKQQIQEMQTAYDAQFPDVINGIIDIVSDKTTTIKLKNGVEYLISPARPESFFADSGIKNGDNVESRGRITADNTFSLGNITIYGQANSQKQN